MPDAPAATPALSTTSARPPPRATCHAVESPCTPAPTTRTGTDEGSVAIAQRTLYKFVHSGYARRRLGATGEMSVVEGNGSVAIGSGAVHTFGGTVADVLGSSRIAP